MVPAGARCRGDGGGPRRGGRRFVLGQRRMGLTGADDSAQPARCPPVRAALDAQYIRPAAYPAARRFRVGAVPGHLRAPLQPRIRPTGGDGESTAERRNVWRPSTSSIGNGVDAPVTDSAIVALFENDARADELRAEIDMLERAGLRRCILADSPAGSSMTRCRWPPRMPRWHWPSNSSVMSIPAGS